MARPKYKVKYCDEVVEYFSRFLEMRDDPDAQGASEELKVKSEKWDTCGKPCSGYPSLIKFARKIGVTPRTLTNWRQRYPQFDEACEFADMIQDEVLNERGLAGTVDGRVAMKIRELKMSARRSSDGEGGGLGRHFGIDIVRYIDSKDGLEINEWSEGVSEDDSYKQGTN